MFNSTTLRNVMSALALALVISTCSATMANACDGDKTNRSVTVTRPLPALLNKIKHLFSSRNDSTKSEPTDDAGYVTTDDAEQLPITP